MTWWSTSCRRLVEARTSQIGARPDDQNGGIKTTHWFWGAAGRIQHAADKKQIAHEAEDDDLGDDEPDKELAGETDAEKELNELLLANPSMVAAALPAAMSAKGLKVVKTTEAFKRWFKERAVEGGPGSGRYPAGSAGGGSDSSGGDSSSAAGSASTKSGGRIKKQAWDDSTKDTPEYDLRKSNAKVAKIQAKIADTKAKLDAATKNLANIDKAHADALAASRARTAGKIAAAHQKYNDRMAAIQKKYAKRKEADSSSSFAQVTREAKFVFKSTNLRESVGDDGVGPTKFKVVLLQEGLGNFGDAFYYHRDALESAVPVFTGSKIYADHPSTVDEEIRPERSVRDVLGHFENLKIETDKTDRAMLTGEVCILPDKPFEWARGLMRHAIEHSKKFPDKDFVGLSINASGDADETPIDTVLKDAPASAKPKLVEAKNHGIESVKVVRQIKSAVSCDLVTEAGAGGKIINFIEGGNHNGKKRSR